ncbi:MAG TPA: M23 family metallopeptidase, partial [Prolixibacteraceae bacterium]|nr:M23 family metallopeptidase [Prolixibacteraceae bacterium]
MKLTLLTCILFLTIFGFSQTRYYSDPMKIPLNLSASFGELRSNHFHSGIDIKTKGVTGLPVNSVADGFISRIAISPVGFGHALYIDHPNGTTTVYAHLQSFRDDIEAYVKGEQYNQKSFRVDLQVPPEKFKVVQNEIIAYSG